MDKHPPRMAAFNRTYQQDPGETEASFRCYTATYSIGTPMQVKRRVWDSKIRYLFSFWQVHTTKTLAPFLTVPGIQLRLESDQSYAPSILLSQLPPTKGNIDEN